MNLTSLQGKWVLRVFYVVSSLLLQINVNASEISSITQSKNDDVYITSINIKDDLILSDILGFKLNGQDISSFFVGPNSEHVGYKVYYVMGKIGVESIRIETESPLLLANGIFEIQTISTALSFDLKNVSFTNLSEYSSSVVSSIEAFNGGSTRQAASKAAGNMVVVYGTVWNIKLVQLGGWFSRTICSESKATAGAYVQISRNSGWLADTSTDEFGHYVMSFENASSSAPASITARKDKLTSKYVSKAFGTGSQTIYGYLQDLRIIDPPC